MTSFVQRNEGWNAEPNAPMPEVTVERDSVRLEFTAHGFQFPVFGEDERVSLLFRGAFRYRVRRMTRGGFADGVGSVTQLPCGASFGKCGDLRLDRLTDAWRIVSDPAGEGLHHYLLSLRDETFECTAASWEFKRGEAPHQAPEDDVE